MAQTDAEYGGRVGQILESTLVGMTLSIGCKTGLIAKLIEFDGEPKTSAEIAKSLGLRERYVREWLKAVLVAKIIESDPTGTKFFLSKSRGEGLLTPLNSVLELAGLSTSIADCFRPDGPTGLPYSAYPTFSQNFAAGKGQLYEATFVQQFIPSLPDNMCEKLESGIKVLDIACGNAAASICMARAYPKSSFTAIDFTEELLNIGKAKVEEIGLKNLSLLLMDATKLKSEWTEEFDFVMVVDGLHDTAYPRETLKEIHRVLRPSGVFALVDVGLHTNPVENRNIPGATEFCALSLFHCMPVSLYYPNGEGLGNNWGMEMAKEYVSQAGFKDVLIEPNLKGLDGQFLAFCRK